MKGVLNNLSFVNHLLVKIDSFPIPAIGHYLQTRYNFSISSKPSKLYLRKFFLKEINCINKLFNKI